MVSHCLSFKKHQNTGLSLSKIAIHVAEGFCWNKSMKKWENGTKVKNEPNAHNFL